MWIKVHDDFLRGSARKLKPEERAVMIDLLLVAASSPTPGTLEVADGVSWHDGQLADRLQISRRLLKDARAALIAADILTVDERDRLRFKNWRRYQSEYSRVKSWRSEASRQGANDTHDDTHDDTRNDTRNDTHIEVDIEKDSPPPLAPPRRAPSRARKATTGLGFAAHSKHGAYSG
jgi:hypothetical protein